ncbi:MAG TPA: ribonuclease E inhibitor RraB [Candidatus Limnocylindrales bacterium]|nr:ribonuclease E inhibitor RraB [Candidatus Limnocylindrales bacterium]
MPWFSRKKSDDEPVDLNDRSPQLGIKYKDLQILGMLMAAGADIRQARHALYYLYFSTPEAAEAGANAARAAGYTCNVGEPIPERPDLWMLTCERPDVVLEPTNVIAADDLFQGIADRHGGEFDGWEASAQP